MSIRRLTLATLTSLCALAGGFAFSAVPALAVAPEAPVTLSPAKAITATSAVLEGTLNPGAVAKAGWYFAYSTEFTCLAGAPTTPLEAEVEGKALPEHVEVTGLEPSKAYTFCMVATDVAGEQTPSSNEVSFTTLAAKPTVDSENTSAVSAIAATLEAQVNPNNQATVAYLQYSTSATVNGSGSLTTATTQIPTPPGSALGSSYGDRPVGPAALTGLPAGSTYYYQAVATNATGVSYGAVQSFTTVPTPHTDPVSVPTAATATFNGHLTLNPVDTRYSFNYRAGTECTGGSSTPTADAGTGAGNAFVSTTATELLPGTQYTVCFVTSNAFGSEQGPPVSFTTLVTEPAITSESVTEVTATSARLGAQIDPGGAETTYHFEYGTTGAYGQETSETPIGADNSNHATPANVQTLQPNTTYHYRIVATNSQSPAGGTMGPDRTFTTQSAGKGFALPDGRQYELVSPPLKDGAEVLEIGGGGETPGGGDPTQASEDGTSVTYITNAPVSQRGPGNTYSTQLISTRGTGGWSSREISPPHIHSVQTFVNEGEQFKRFSSDLSRAVLIPLYYPAEPPLAPELHQEVARGQEIYLRNNVTEAFQALDTSEPLPEAGSTGRQPMAFEGGSPDLSHVVFQGPAGLDPKYPAGGELYEWFNGQAHLVSVLPNNEPTSGLLGGDFEGSFGIIKEGASVVDWHAVSNDGTRVFWTSSGGTYMRNSATEKTIPIPGQFQTASSDGSRVFTTEGGNLYMFDVAGEKPTNLTSNPGGGQLQEVVGANEEDTSIYVLAGAVLTEVANGQGEIAKEGANNLYLLREAPVGSGSWSTTFIADGLEEGSGESFGAEAPLAKKTVRVSPNGRYVAFMSRRSLTGYDNHDANSGQPDTEVYLYAAEANKLACASCNPTGARPVGEYDTGEFPGSRMDPTTIWAGVWLAATIPGWTGTSSVGTSGYQPRFLSDGGQLFFTSADALVPQDVNGKDNVYEYEAAGVGSCQAPDYGQSASLVFNKTAGGCVGLISAGTGIGDSIFFDASASGSDVFFTTSDGLASQDKDGVSDMYDARVCTTAEPCPASVALPPSCTTTDSCRTAPLRQPGVFGPPPSATFEGAGNVSPTPVLANGPKPKTAAQIRAEKLAKALRACRSKPRAKRRGCEALARKRYGKAKSSGRRIK